jgi:hypothetical protein
MNVEIGAEAALFLEKEYISGIFFAVYKPLHPSPASGLRVNSTWPVKNPDPLHPPSPLTFTFTTRETPLPCTILMGGDYHRVHRVATAAFWRTFYHEDKISPC